jgi:hypothetical protein
VVPNGKPGDNPITDVAVWGHAVYGEDIDSLVREIYELLREEPEIMRAAQLSSRRLTGHHSSA